MKVEVTEDGACRRRIDIEIEPGTVEERISERVREYRRTRVVPGFRPGKATTAIVRRRYGKEIRAEVLRDLIPEVWNQAVEENELSPVNQPDIARVDAEPGEPVRITGTVDVKPDIEIANYKGLKITRELRPVTDDDVDRQIEMIRKQRADEASVDRPAQNDDVITADFQELDETGIPLIGRKREDQRWILGGPGSPSQELDEQLVGISKGESRRVMFTYREDYYDESVAGQEARATVTVKDVVERQLPELDEDFFKDVGDFATLDDLKNAIREDQEARARAVAQRGVHRQMREQLVRDNVFAVPESMVERYLTTLFRQHQQQGHEHDEEVFRAEHRAEAISEVRAMLILERIGEQEKIVIEDEKVDVRIADMATYWRANPERLRGSMVDSGRYETMRAEMRDAAILDFLEAHAEVEEVEVKGD